MRVFQDLKLQEQMVIIYNEISKEFQPIAGFLDLMDMKIQLKQTCFAVTDLQYAFDKSMDQILLQGGKVIFQITPLHIKPNDQLWIRSIDENVLIEIIPESFGFFCECSLSSTLQIFTMN